MKMPNSMNQIIAIIMNLLVIMAKKQKMLILKTTINQIGEKVFLIMSLAI